MFPSWFRGGVQSGLIAAAATGGALIGFGIRHGDWSGPFLILGSRVIQGYGASNSATMLPTAIGIAAHISWMVVWGIVFASVSQNRTRSTAVVIAVAVGIGAALIARSILPAAMGAIRFASLPGVQAALCVALMTAGLVTGRVVSRAD